MPTIVNESLPLRLLDRDRAPPMVAAMSSPEKPDETQKTPQNSPDAALKKARKASKGGTKDREARLAEALRANLRRRKAAGGAKEQD